MSAKNCDKYNRWRSITIGFRVSPEEAYALDMRVLTSGLTKQDYCTKKVLDEEVIVRPNIRVQKYVCQYLNELTEELKRLEKIEQTNDVLDNLKYLLELIAHLSEQKTKMLCFLRQSISFSGVKIQSGVSTIKKTPKTLAK